MVMSGCQLSRGIPNPGCPWPASNKFSLNIAVVLGSTFMPVHQVLRLGRGAVIELDSGENDEVRIMANDFPVAKGAVVVSGNRIAVEVKECSRARRHAVTGRGASAGPALVVIASEAKQSRSKERDCFGTHASRACPDLRINSCRSRVNPGSVRSSQ